MFQRKSLILILGISGTAASIAILAALIWRFSWPVTDNPIACTMEAKLCPDGSAVGRVGPRCEFAPCPSPAGPAVPQRATLTGTYLCLPHVDTAGPQTEECAFGLKTDDGLYYALDFGLLSQGVPDFASGDRITASGVITPLEQLSTDHWRRYPIEGIFSVTDSAQKL